MVSFTPHLVMMAPWGHVCVSYPTDARADLSVSDGDAERGSIRRACYLQRLWARGRSSTALHTSPQTAQLPIFDSRSTQSRCSMLRLALAPSLVLAAAAAVTLTNTLTIASPQQSSGCDGRSCPLSLFPKRQAQAGLCTSQDWYDPETRLVGDQTMHIWRVFRPACFMRGLVTSPTQQRGWSFQAV